MSTPHFTERPGDMDILDLWTQRSLDAYWKELVKETQEVNLTGPSDEYDSDTGPSDWLYLRILKNRLPWEPKTGFPQSPQSPRTYIQSPQNLIIPVTWVQKKMDFSSLYL